MCPDRERFHCTCVCVCVCVCVCSKKQEDARSMRQISQLKKESRKKEHKIQSLEADVQRKAIVMKRKADEVIITSSCK